MNLEQRLSSLQNQTGLIMKADSWLRGARENLSISTEDRGRKIYDFSRNFENRVDEFNRDLLELNKWLRSLSEDDRKSLKTFPLFELVKVKGSPLETDHIVEQIPTFRIWLDKVSTVSKSLSDRTLDLPEQERALKLIIGDQGEIELDRQTGGADEKRVEALKPGLLRLLGQASEAFSKGNAFYGFVADTLEEYREEIDRPANEIEFGLVFTLGSEIKYALAEARLKDADPILPDLPPRGAAKVEAVLETHLPFLMASELGRDLVADKEILIETPEEARDGREAIEALRHEVETSEGIFEADAKKAVVAGLQGGDVNATLFSRKVAKNVGIVCAGATLCAAGPVAGLIGVGAAVGVGTVSGIALLFKGEAFVKAGGELKDDLTPSVKTGLSRIREFTITQKDVFARSVNLADKGDWFRKLIERTVARSSKGKIKPSKGMRILIAVTQIQRRLHTKTADFMHQTSRDAIRRMGFEFDHYEVDTLDNVIDYFDPDTDILIIDNVVLTELEFEKLLRLDKLLANSANHPHILLRTTREKLENTFKQLTSLYPDTWSKEMAGVATSIIQKMNIIFTVNRSFHGVRTAISEVYEEHSELFSANFEKKL